jgi:hypothetical protein
VAHRALNPQNLKQAWNETFEVEATYIDGNYLKKIRWSTDDHIDYTKYMIKPTLFFISDDLNISGINEGATSASNVSLVNVSNQQTS